MILKTYANILLLRKESSHFILVRLYKFCHAFDSPGRKLEIVSSIAELPKELYMFFKEFAGDCRRRNISFISAIHGWYPRRAVINSVTFRMCNDLLSSV